MDLILIGFKSHKVLRVKVGVEVVFTIESILVRKLDTKESRFTGIVPPRVGVDMRKEFFEESFIELGDARVNFIWCRFGHKVQVDPHPILHGFCNELVEVLPRLGIYGMSLPVVHGMV